MVVLATAAGTDDGVTVRTVEKVDVFVRKTVDSEEVVWISTDVTPELVCVKVAVTGQMVMELSMNTVVRTTLSTAELIGAGAETAGAEVGAGAELTSP